MASILNVPGIGAYLQRQQMAQQGQTQEIQQAAGLMGLVNTIRQQQVAQTEMERESAIRSEIAALPPEKRTRENVLPILLKHSGSSKAVIGALPEDKAIGAGGLLKPDGTVVPPAARTGGEKKAPPLRTRYDGETAVQEEMQPDGTWKEVGRGPRFSPGGGSSSEPLHPIVGPDGKPVLVPRSQAVGKTPYNASIAGQGNFSEDALDLVAEQYLAGDRQAAQGYARNATARIALQNRIAQKAKDRGWSGADIAAQMADFAGITAGSRTVGTRAAQIELASNEALTMIDIVLDRSKTFERTNFVPFNIALKAFETNTGQPEVKAFGAAINSLVNVYARAISPSGVPTVSDKEHAREMLASVDSPAQVKAVTDVMKEEMAAAKKAPTDVQRSTRRRVVSGATQPPVRPNGPTGAPGAVPTATNAQGQKIYFWGGQWQSQPPQ